MRKKTPLKSDGGQRGRMHPRPEALYYHVALTALKRAQKETDEFERKQAVVTAMVFSHLCLEAFINQEYVSHPETPEFSEIERTPLEEKWRLLPHRLGAKDTFAKNSAPWEVFRELVLIRNDRLVHFKPLNETHETPRGKKRPKEPYFSDLVNDVPRAERYVKCIGDMIRKLNEITGKTSVPSFLSGHRYMSEVSAQFTVNY